MTPLHKLVAFAAAYIGLPYVWGGKGWDVWGGVNVGLRPHTFPTAVFDCSGLVTHCMEKAGYPPTLRGKHSAQTMYDAFPPGDALRFYGRGPDSVTHVAVCVCERDGKHFLIEAAGGHATVTNPSAAKAKAASVRAGWESRKDFVGARGLPSLGDA